MNTNAHANRGAKLALAGVLALGSMIVVLAISGTREGHAATGHQHGDGAAMPAQTAKQLAFHDGMRELWEQHVAWTRLAIVSFAGGNPDLAATEVGCCRIRSTSATRSSRTTARPQAIS